MASMRRPKAVRGDCPYCGTTQKELEDTGLAGCPLCYEAFPPAVWSQFGLELGGRALE
jgi:protein-arginine kinase activator protein McsA